MTLVAVIASLAIGYLVGQINRSEKTKEHHAHRTTTTAPFAAFDGTIERLENGVLPANGLPGVAQVTISIANIGTTGAKPTCEVHSYEISPTTVQIGGLPWVFSGNSFRGTWNLFNYQSDGVDANSLSVRCW
jgi:hypothetical protein